MDSRPDSRSYGNKISNDVRRKREPGRMKEICILFGAPSLNESHWNSGNFCPDSQQSTINARLSYRENSAVVSIGRGKVMISGGLMKGKRCSAVEVFSCREKLIRPVASLNIGRWGHGVCSVGDAVIVCGGDNNDILDACEVFYNGRWQVYTYLNCARTDPAIVSSPDRQIFAIGGLDRGDACSSCVETCRLPHDLSSCVLPDSESSWRYIASMQRARRGAGAVFFQGNIIVAGGANEDEEGNLSSVEMLTVDRKDKQWILLPASMKLARYDFSIVLSSRGIFAFGNDETACNSVELLKLEEIQDAFTTPMLNSVIERVSSAGWESLSPILSMARVHKAVII